MTSQRVHGCGDNYKTIKLFNIAFMPIQSQCTQCKRYNQEVGFCRKTWTVPDFNDALCEGFKDLNVENATENQNVSSIQDTDSSYQGNENETMISSFDADDRTTDTSHRLKLRTIKQFIHDVYDYAKGRWLVTGIMLWFFIVFSNGVFLNRLFKQLPEDTAGIIGLVYLLFITPHGFYGIYNSFLMAIRNDARPKLSNFLCGFMNYGTVWLQFILTMFVIFVYFLFFIIPGIMKMYSLMMVPYVRYDNPQMSYQEVLKTSSEMMNGYRMNLFLLHLRLIFELLLGPTLMALAYFVSSEKTLLTSFTFLIGALLFIGAVPVVGIETFASQAMFYEDVKGIYTARRHSLGMIVDYVEQKN